MVVARGKSVLGSARVLDRMHFSFDERKARAAASVLLECAGGRMPYIRLIKLLYLADRESFDRRARPIVGGRYVSMNYGPVLSEVLNLIRQESAVWSKAIEKQETDVVLRGAPDVGPLSDDEIGILREAFDLFNTLDRWKLVDFTHQLPEWQDPKGSAIDITPEEILRALQKTDESVEEARQGAQERAHFEAIFGH